jgi:hypothetical protein
VSASLEWPLASVRLQSWKGGLQESIATSFLFRFTGCGVTMIRPAIHVGCMLFLDRGLVWFDKTVYIKRLDDELLSWEYFSKIGCNNEVVHRAASGFLLSYTHLTEYPSEDLLTTTSAGKSGVPSGPVSCTTLLTAVVTSTTATSMENSASADSTRFTAWSSWALKEREASSAQEEEKQTASYDKRLKERQDREAALAKRDEESKASKSGSGKGSTSADDGAQAKKEIDLQRKLDDISVAEQKLTSDRAALEKSKSDVTAREKELRQRKKEFEDQKGCEYQSSGGAHQWMGRPCWPNRCDHVGAQPILL